MPEAIPRNVLVYGGGSVGLGLASCLHAAGVGSLAVVGRDDTVSAVTRDGIRRTGIFGEHVVAPGEVAAAAMVDDVSERAFDHILVCTKSFDTATVARELLDCPPAWDDDTRFVLCQNGYGNYEAFTELFPPEQVFLGRVITGFARTSPNEVAVTVHAAPIHLGNPDPSLNDRVAGLAGAITEGGIPAEVSDTIVEDLWAKILYNVLLNPLGAVLGVPYGMLGESGDTRATMARLANETYAVMDALGAVTHWPDSAAFLDTFYVDMLPPTAAHESSMLQDIQAGRRTEIDALNGAVMRLGAEHGVPTPTHQTVVELLRFIEALPS